MFRKCWTRIVGALRAMISFVLGGSATTWGMLRIFGNSPIAHATVVMPVLGYLLILNTSFLNWVDPDSHLLCGKVVRASQDKFIPLLYTHSWRLVVIYLGLTATGIATALFGLFCPFSQKKYGDSVDYALGTKEFYANDHRWTSLANTLVIATESRKGFLGWACSNDFVQDLRIRVDAINQRWPLKDTGSNSRREAADEATIISTLRTHYRLTGFENPMTRFLIATLYLAGICLVVMSSLWGIAEVIAHLIGESLVVSPLCWIR